MSTSQPPALASIVDRVRAAAADATPLRIVGGGSKDFYGGALLGEPLDLRPLTGILSYEPSELVVTALAGTPLAELEATLAARNQCLPFEPPRFAAGGTVGGMVAAGLSGPARASTGSVRDYVLGASLLNGRGELLTLGGQVMKNVAGYDLSRLLAGSLGILGVITQASLKVMPVAAAEATLEFDFNEADALRQLNAWSAQPLPLNASLWTAARGDGALYLRLRGARSAVESSALRLGGRQVDAVAAAALWQECRDHASTWFRDTRSDTDLWRVSVPQTTPVLALPGTHQVEWHGGLRWYRLPPGSAATVRQAARAAGGHATLFRRAGVATDARSTPAFDSPGASVAAIHRRLKQEFDPHGLFNRQRLYDDL